MPNTISSTLLELGERLKANGMVVISRHDYLEVRLGHFTSIRVRLADGHLECEPRFGLLSRDMATWGIVFTMATVAVSHLLSFGVTPVGIALGFLGLTSIGAVNIRYQITESCVTRVHMVWTLMHETLLDTTGALPSPAFNSLTANVASNPRHREPTVGDEDSKAVRVQQALSKKSNPHS